MEKIKLLFFIFLFIFFSPYSLANFSRLETKLSLEKRKQLDLEEKKAQLQKESEQIKVQIRDVQEYAQYQKTKTKKAMAAMILENMASRETGDVLLMKRQWKNQALQESAALGKIQEEMSEIQGRSEELSRLSSEYLLAEKSMTEKIQELEKQKEVSQVSQVTQIQHPIKESIPLGLPEITQAEKTYQFRPPLDKFGSIDHGQKGINFHYKFPQKVMAPRSGKVVYVGPLASYGNVVMIEHSPELRSVVLGEFLPSVKKDQTLAQGDFLGQTSQKGKSGGNIYFEIRKKDRAQKTVGLIDPQLLKL